MRYILEGVDGTLGTKRLKKEDYVALARFRATLRRFLHHSDEGARQAGVTPQQHQLVLAIKGSEREAVSVAEIAEALQIRHHAAVGLANRCEEAKLISRSVDPADRRQVRLTVTERGEAVLAQLAEHNREELEALRHALSLEFLDTEEPHP